MSIETDLAWAAGFIDGEGCITIRRYRVPGGRNLAYQVAIVVANTHRESVEKVCAILGVGKIFILKKDASLPYLLPSWQYHANAQQAKQVLTKIYPYLVTKKRDADIALEYLNMEIGSYGRNGVPDEIMQKREELYWRIRENRGKANKLSSSASH